LPLQLTERGAAYPWRRG